MLRYLNRALAYTTGYWYSSVVLCMTIHLDEAFSMGGSVAEAHSPSPTPHHEPLFQLVRRLAIQELEDKSQGIFLFPTLQFEYIVCDGIAALTVVVRLRGGRLLI